MKKLISIIVALSIILTLSGSWAYASANVAVNVSVDNTGTVSISGTISSGQGKQVTVVVFKPNKSVSYIDQETSGVGGHYSFSYTISDTKYGKYTVTVGGEDVSSPLTTTFNYTPGGDKNNAKEKLKR